MGKILAKNWNYCVKLNIEMECLQKQCKSTKIMVSISMIL